MIIKTVTTTEGLNTIVFDDFYKYFWVKNKGDAPVNVSAFCTCAAGSDNTVEISPNDSVLLENGDDDCVYVTGASVVEIHAQNFPDCPFKFAPAGGGGGGTSFPIGVIMPTATATAPNGWLICDGSEVSRATYSVLFSAIGEIYGTGDGATTFNLPNLKGKIPVGYDESDTDFNNIGKTGGEKTHTLTVNEMPAHSHSGVIAYVYNNTGYSSQIVQVEYGSGNNTFSSNATSKTTGGGQPHNIVQPYVVMNYIIYAGV